MQANSLYYTDDSTANLYKPEIYMYRKIPIIRPLSGLSKSGLKDHFWTVPKVVSNQGYTGCG